MRNYNEIFRKDVTYDNTKSHEKPGIYHFCEKFILGKTTNEGLNWPPPLPSTLLGLRISAKICIGKVLNKVGQNNL